MVYVTELNLVYLGQWVYVTTFEFVYVALRVGQR